MFLLHEVGAIKEGGVVGCSLNLISFRNRVAAPMQLLADEQPIGFWFSQGFPM